MIQKKVCMLGAFSVGKTSLVGRFVHSVFSEKYLTTVGVKIDKKTIDLDGNQMKLLLWDLAGEDDYTKLRTSYLRGSAGYLLVVDGTRSTTLDSAIEINEMVHESIGDVPFVVLLNKSDLVDKWEIDELKIDGLSAKGWKIMRSSAKTGEAVEEAFSSLAQMMLDTD